MIPEGQSIVRLEIGHPFLEFAGEDIARAVEHEIDSFIVMKNISSEHSALFTFYTVEQDNVVNRMALICPTRGAVVQSPFSHEEVMKRLRIKRTAEKFGI